MTDQLATQEIIQVFTSPTQYIEVTISDADIVPDEYQAELIQMRESWVKQYFRVGDIANELVQHSVRQNMPVTARRVYKAIGRYCGKAERTVRYYAENAIFFSPGSREEYSFLPMAFFDLARNYGQRWQDVLEYAALHPAMTYDELLLAITSNLTVGHGDDPINNEDLDKSLENVSLPSYTRHRSDGPTFQHLPRTVTPDAMKFIVEFGTIIDRVFQALRSFEIPAEMSDKIAFHLNELKKVITEAVKQANYAAKHNNNMGDD